MPKPRSASGSAVRPASAAPLATNVAFIVAVPKFNIARDRAELIQAVRNAMEAGSDIVNAAFNTGRSGDGHHRTMLPELTSVFNDEWSSSVVQPDGTKFLSVGSVVTFYRESCVTVLDMKMLDPEEGLPASVLTFGVPEGILCATPRLIDKKRV